MLNCIGKVCMDLEVLTNDLKIIKGEFPPVFEKVNSVDRRLQEDEENTCKDRGYSYKNIEGWKFCYDIKDRKLKLRVYQALRQDLKKINSFLPPKASLFLK